MGEVFLSILFPILYWEGVFSVKYPNIFFPFDGIGTHDSFSVVSYLLSSSKLPNTKATGQIKISFPSDFSIWYWCCIVAVSGVFNGASFFRSVLPLDQSRGVFSPAHEDVGRMVLMPQDVGFRRTEVMGYCDDSDARDSIVIPDGPSWISKFLGTANGRTLLIVSLNAPNYSHSSHSHTNLPITSSLPLSWPQPALYLCLYVHEPAILPAP